MILVLGGTYDSRKLVEGLLDLGRQVIYSSVTAYNVSDLPNSKRLESIIGALDEAGLRQVMVERAITCLIDATHPYACEVSINAIAACEKEKIPYLRMERERMKDDGKRTLGFKDYDAVVDYLQKHEGQVLVTTGSRQLEAYERLPKERLIIRVLPTAKVLAKCESLGYHPQNIIAMQGPFSYDMNIAMIRQYKVTYLVTKDSGEVGGVDDKLLAAEVMGVQVLYIKRPEIDYPRISGNIDETLVMIETENIE